MATKCIVNLGWKSFVMDTDKAVTMMELLDGCEMYEEIWHREEGDTKPYTSYHVYDPEEPAMGSIKLLPNSIYKVAKLAGKPEKN
jgi:hypothetical protein